MRLRPPELVPPSQAVAASGRMRGRPQHLVRAAAAAYGRRARSKRAGLFIRSLASSAHDRILDLGSEDGSHIAAIVPYRENVFIADIDERALEDGRRRFGFQPVLLAEDGRLPFPDG